MASNLRHPVTIPACRRETRQPLRAPKKGDTAARTGGQRAGVCRRRGEEHGRCMRRTGVRRQRCSPTKTACRCTSRPGTAQAVAVRPAGHSEYILSPGPVQCRCSPFEEPRLEASQPRLLPSPLPVPLSSPPSKASESRPPSSPTLDSAPCHSLQPSQTQRDQPARSRIRGACACEGTPEHPQHAPCPSSPLAYLRAAAAASSLDRPSAARCPLPVAARREPEQP
ncbi:hypothetical protein PSPO01_07088 [Paraphaeosphaeria sporulosa]